MKISGKEELIRIALDLMAEEGYAALTMSRLGEEAGLSKASLYHYWKAKEEILEDIYDSGHKNLMKKGFRLNLKGSTEEVLLNAASHWEEIFTDEENYPYLRFIFSMHLTDEKAQEEYRSLTLMLHSQAQVIIESFGIDRLYTQILTELFSSLLFTRMEKVLEGEEINLQSDVKSFALLIGTR
ncbi:MAG: TetR/AcrR family transcriptional regulator [Spirochaetales bacterium]|nr:TetR/AcrR family transcriptional regulator [Candidatus Physcosoma equi]